MTTSLAFRILAPYLAVAICWFGFGNAWLTVAAYHLQIILWSRRSFTLPNWRLPAKHLLLILPAALVGPAVYFLLPHITGGQFGDWLTKFNVTPTSLLIMLPYFGLVHPWIEQTHWNHIRERTPLAHICFAGYHVIILAQLAPPAWLIVVFLALATVSWIWKGLTRHTQSLTPAYLTHALADTGIVIAAWLHT